MATLATLVKVKEMSKTPFHKRILDQNVSVGRFKSKRKNGFLVKSRFNIKKWIPFQLLENYDQAFCRSLAVRIQHLPRE